MGPWRTISVALKADASGIVRGTATGSAAVKKFGADSERTLRQHEQSVGRAGSKWRSVGKVVAGGLAVVGIALGLSLREAIAWESAFAGVAKTVDGTAAELAELEGGLLSMARHLPATRTEIAGVAEAAGALGIEREAILGFTETMIGLGEATNLTADEAATMLAQFANIMGTSQAEFEGLADTLVHLGNNGASTEREIMALALRLAGIGTTVGLTENEVFALANAMASMGIDAELGGGALSRVMRKIEMAVAGGGEKLAAFAEASEMSAQEFAAAWENDPAKALQSFLESMKDVQDAGGNMYGVLAELGIKGSQDVDVIGRLIAGSDGLAASFRDAEEAAGALATEVEKRYATAEAQLRIFMNRVTDVARIVGAALIPMMLAALAAVEAFGRWMLSVGIVAAEKLEGAWGDLQDAGENIVDLFGSLWAGAKPVVTILGQLGGALAIVGLRSFASLLEATTGFLADHEELVVAIGVAYAGWKIVGTISGVSGALALMEVRARVAFKALAASNLGTIGSGAADVARNLLTVPDASDRMAAGVSTGFAKIRTGLNGLATSVGPVNGALLGVAIGAGLAFRSIQIGAAAAEKRVAEFIDTLQIDPNDPQSVVSGLEAISDRAKELEKQAEDPWDNKGGPWWTRPLVSKNTLDRMNPFNENEIQDARDELKLLGAESDRISIAFVKNARAAVLFGKANKLSYEEVRSAARRAGIDISTAFDENGNASKELQAAIDEATEVGESGLVSLSEAATMSADELDLVKESLERIRTAGEAAQSAWSSWSSILGVTDDPVDAAAVGRSQKMVDDARERVREAEKEARVGGQSTDEAQRTADALADARAALVDATAAHSDLLATDSPLNSDKVKQFYDDRLAEARTFTDNMNTAIEAGYDPQLLSRLMQAGPEAAGPVLAALVEDTSAAYVASINEAETKLAEFTVFATRQAQLTQRAIEVGGRQMAEDLGTAMAIEQMSMANPNLTGNEIATKLGISFADAQRVIDNYGLEVRVYSDTETAKEQINAFTAERREALIGVDTDTEAAEKAFRQLARDRTVKLSLDAPWLKDASWWDDFAAGGKAPWFLGNSNSNRWGGITSYATGGIKRHAMVGTGRGLVHWDEPETGGEAYVPRYGNRWRSIGVLAEAAGWYGMALTPKAANQQPPAPRPVPYSGALVPAASSSVDNSRRAEVTQHFHEPYRSPSSVQRATEAALGVYG